MYTRLDIINEMIVSTGARPLTAEQTTHPLYLKAEQLLDRVQASVQALGLWFNTEMREIAQQANGEVIVPQTCIRADPVERRYNLTLRGRKLYDLNTGTFQIGEDLRLKMIFNIPLEDMPLSAKEYVRTKAVYEFYLNEDGDRLKVEMYLRAKEAGWKDLYREHIRNLQMNVLDNPFNTFNRIRRGYPEGRWEPRSTQ